MGCGVVIASFGDSKNNKKGASSIVFEDFSQQESCIFVIPRRLFDFWKLRRKGKSRNQAYKLSQELGVGDRMRFNARGDQICWYEEFMKDQSYKFEDKFKVIEWNNCIAMKVTVIVSDEEPRRFHCYDIGDQFSIPNCEMQKVLPNVLYEIFVHINLDFGGYNPHTEPSERCHPTFKITFGSWLRALNPDLEKIGRAPWNHERNGHVRRVVRDSYVILAAEPLPNPTQQKCLVIDVDGKELWCPQFPDQKCLLAFVNPDDVTLVNGRLLQQCEMFFSFQNNAYVVYNYSHCDGNCGIEEHKDQVTKQFPKDPRYHFGIEDPMQVRVTKEGRHFLAYAKLNLFGHFYCSASIPLIGDPNNILHGYTKLGDDNDIFKFEFEQGEGIPVWVKYLEKKTNVQSPTRFEVVSLAEKMYHVNSKGKKIKLEKSLQKTPFTSTGLLLNKRGTVYCPHVCNFPIVWAKPKLEVGTLFKFQAKFSESAQKYKVIEMLGIAQKFPFETVKLSTEKDSYAFRIPLKSNADFTASLLLDKLNGTGFVEDLLIGNIAAYGLTLKRLGSDKELMVWCRENPNLERRITPFFCMQIDQPEGEMISGN